MPVANKDLWSWQPFPIFQVALGIRLLAGVCKPLAWLVSQLCFTGLCS